jgi:hypothetical protein
MYTEQVRDIVPPSSQNIVAVYKQFTLLIFYYISSRLVTTLKVTGAPIHVSDTFYLAVSFNLIDINLYVRVLWWGLMSLGLYTSMWSLRG